MSEHAVAVRRDPEAAHGVAVVLGRAPGPAHVQEPVAGADRGRGVGHGRLQRRAGRDAVTGRQAAHRPPTEGVRRREGEADVGPVLQPLPRVLDDGGAELLALPAGGVGEDQALDRAALVRR